MFDRINEWTDAFVPWKKKTIQFAALISIFFLCFVDVGALKNEISKNEWPQIIKLPFIFLSFFFYRGFFLVNIFMAYIFICLSRDIIKGTAFFDPLFGAFVSVLFYLLIKLSLSFWN